MAKIGQLLISQGLLSQDDLDEALGWQVLYGGRLGTNLLELQLVKEEDLAHALGKQLGAEVAWGNLEVDPALVGSIPKHVADRQEIVPWKLEKRRLKLLCCEIRVAELDQLSYKIGRTCVPVIAPEYRIYQLLRAHYGATRQMRALDFGIVPEEGRSRRKKKEAEQGARAEQPAELMEESAFNDLYAQVVQGRSAAPPSAWPASPYGYPPPPPPGYAYAPGYAPAPPGYPYPPGPSQPAPSWQQQGRPPPPVMTAVQAPEPPAVEEKLEELPADAIIEELPAEAQPEPEAEPLRVVSWDDVPAPPPEPPRDETPLDFKQALQALQGVSDRDAIAHIVLRASRSKAARALLLQVQGGVALGWDGLGEGLENAAAAQVAMPLGSGDSAFSLVVKTRSHYMGPLQKTPLNIRFLATLGKRVPLSALIIPILHNGRVSHMLYLDNGHRQQAPTDVGEMLILSQRIGQTVTELVERKRKAARG